MNCVIGVFLSLSPIWAAAIDPCAGAQSKARGGQVESVADKKSKIWLIDKQVMDKLRLRWRAAEERNGDPRRNIVRGGRADRIRMAETVAVSGSRCSALE